MWIKTSLIALGLAGAMAAATPAPTLAQGVHIGPGGVGIDIGRPGYRERHYRGGAYDDYAYDRRHRGAADHDTDAALASTTLIFSLMAYRSP